MPENDNVKTIINDSRLTTFVPTDYSDVAQGTILAEAYGHCLRYCEGIGWLTFKDGRWEQSDVAAHKYSQKLTELQFQEAMAVRCFNLQQGKTKTEDEKYISYILTRRSSGKIAATLKEAIPKLSIRTSDLDRDPLILNTPCGEVDLSTGEMHPHDSAHYITRMTKVAPSDEGIETWLRFVSEISCGEEVVTEFLQQFAGMMAIGKVYEERLLIALGSGGNGKSTFFNDLQDVMGDYAGTIRSELMIASNDSGKKFEYARLRGKRLVIAEELSESKQLDTGAVKQLCSTGDINAQFKGKDVFTFKPSHSTVLCTNHMPTIKANDNGTWDRLIVVPFEARFRNEKTEIKNYGAYLVEHCGGAILSWIIEGSKKYIQNEYKLVVPEELQAEIDSYKDETDWTKDYFEYRLIFGPSYSATGSELYNDYESYCAAQGILALPSNVVLPKIAAHPAVTKKRTSRGTRYCGVKVNIPESLLILQENRVKRREESQEEDEFDSLIDEILDRR